MLRLADSDDEIIRCHTVMQQLRPHISQAEFLLRVRRQMQQGYRLAFLERNAEIVAVAGFRLSENLAWGTFLYVDDLVSCETQRSRGAGKALFDDLVTYARKHGCQQLHLDSGVQRFAAHRFYLREGLQIASHHFALSLVE